MDPSDYLLTISEVSVGLAGFASIVLAIGQRFPNWLPVDRFRMASLFGSSLGALFLALVALGLRSLPISDELTWRLSSGLMAAYVLAFASLMGPLFVRLMRSDPYAPSVLGRRLNYIMAGLAFLNFAAQCGSAVHPALPSRFTIFFFGLVWFLVWAAFALVRTIFARPEDSGPAA